MRTLLHLSDPHFGAERPAVHDALLDCLRRLPFDLVVVSGDLTQRATRGQFQRAADFVAWLRARAPAAPVFVNPGNHDIPFGDPLQRVLDPFARFRGSLRMEPEAFHEDEGLHLQVLNTASRWRHKHGVLVREQVERVAQRLSGTSPRQLRVVVTHQPLAVARAQDRAHLLRGRQPALRLWPAAGVDLVLGGHIHLPYVQRVDDGSSSMWVVQAGTVVSRRIRHEAGNSFNAIHFGHHGQGEGRPSCSVERWDYLERVGRFEPVERTPLSFGDRGDR